ncbi:MAG: DUF2341 domain-containing protein [Candidatus Hadarchaeales archaeon]
MGPSRGVSVMVSVVLILLVLMLAGSALLVLYGRSATRSSEGRLLSSLQTEFLNLQSSLWRMEGGEEVQANLRLSAEEPLLSAWGGRAGGLYMVPSGVLHMRRITITNQVNYPLYDFPVKVVLTTSNFDFGRVRRDGGDIRFYRGEVPLRYYVESWNYPTGATIWVNVPYLPASGTENIEMYYGMSGVESASDPRALWLIMEDMSSAPEGTLKGTAPAEYVEARGYVRLTPNKNNLNGQLEYQLNPGEGFLARFELWAGLSTGGPQAEGADATWLYAYCTSTPSAETSNAGGYHFIFDEYDDQVQIYWAGSAVGTAVARGDIDNLTWHSIEIRHWRKAAGGNENTEIYYDGSLVRADQDSSRTKTGTLFGWGARTGSSNNEHRIRNLYVRKYTYPEPSASVGLEERVSGRPFVGLGFGSLQVEARGWFTPTTRFILEGGAVLVEDSGGCRMLSPPSMISVSGNTLTVTHLLLNGPKLSTVSLGEKRLRLGCTNSGYTVQELRENVVVDLSSRVDPDHQGVWKEYLLAENARLNSLGMNAYLDSLNPLKLTVLGPVAAAGTKDLYYCEKVVEVEVEVLS